MISQYDVRQVNHFGAGPPVGHGFETMMMHISCIFPLIARTVFATFELIATYMYRIRITGA